VAWSIAGYSYANDDAMDVSMPAYSSASDYGGTNYDVYWSSAAIFGMTGAGTNELAYIRVGRYPGAAADTMTAAASLLGVRLDYTRT
jgi:hypothetical protein